MSIIPKMTRVAEDGSSEVAVLISHGFGAGWSTWNQDDKETLLFHKDLVQLVLDGKNAEAGQLAEKMTDAYVGGAEDLEIVWLPEGTQFWVHEYDGSESLRTMDRFDWVTA